MFVPVLLLVFLGHPLGYILGGVATIFGLIGWGPQVFHMFANKFFAMQVNYLLIALPLFIFMGNMLGRSGVAEKLYGALHVWMGPVRGGLALATVIICTIFAAATGIIGASVTAMGLLALPEMLKRKYDVRLSCGTVMAGSTLGILIPPSIMLVIYGAMAQLSVGKLFMACVFPGLLLSGLYCAYIMIRCFFRPELGPPMSVEERQIPMKKKLLMLFTSIAPPMFLILAVLGTIFTGVATPSEASALGAIGSIIIAAANRQLTWEVMKDTVFTTAKTIGMISVIAAGASCFTSVFLGLGGGAVVEGLLLGLPGGKYAALAVIMLILFALGTLLDWFGILLLCIPIFSPVIQSLGFDPIWFAAIVAINLQMSFLSPPYGVALFYLKSVAPEEITMAEIIKSIFPFIGLMILGLIICLVFPQVILWLPNLMIK
ncbi:MAG: TRAP transporter large permease subunit [Syntrophaceae bacterium]|nr:TRAP transporter large permease subunit [Syntrophaceae bacterium]